MRKAYSTIELLVVMVVFSMLSIPLARLSIITLRDIPESYRMIESNTSVLNVLKYIQKDVNSAKAFPKSFKTFSANEQSLLIELAEAVICYQFEEDRILRRTIANNQKGDEVISWPVPKAKIEWKLLEKNGIGVAVEVKTYIERIRNYKLEKKMANSHLYFAGIYAEAINRK